MNVTRKNFREKFEEIKEVINASNFVSFDCEFTGISQDNNRISLYDSPAEYYKKISQQTSGYIAIQIGITAFRLSTADANKFHYRSYNFYVCPQRQQRFECQGDSFAFLASVDFDFNKLFREGISYCDDNETKKLTEKFEEKMKLFESGQSEGSNDAEVTVPVEELELLDNVNAEIKEFLQSEEAERHIGKMCNAFQRKLIYQLLKTDYQETITATSRSVENGRKIIIIEKKKSEQELRDKKIEEMDKARRDLEDKIGFSNFINFLSKSKKIIVGHNMLLDVMYIMKQFIAPLSDKLTEFKKETHKIFPNLIDTKYMCTDSALKPYITSSALADVLSTLANEPFEMPVLEADSEAYAYSLENKREHEAGYDSFITGVAFITMANFLHINSCDIHEGSSKLRHLLNRIFTTRIDTNHINLMDKEPNQHRDHVFHVTFPKTWKTTNIVHLFRTYGGVNISWLDDTSAYVGLNNRENAPILMKHIGKTEGVTILPFADYQSQKDAPHPPVHTHPPDPPVNNKRRWESPSPDLCKSKSKKKNKHQGPSSQHFDNVDDW